MLFDALLYELYFSLALIGIIFLSIIINSFIDSYNAEKAKQIRIANRIARRKQTSTGDINE